MKRAFLATLFFFGLFFLSGCDVDLYTEKPARPANAPESSVWVGGADGGVFVSVRKSDSGDEKLYYGEIYHGSGDVAYKGAMKLLPDGKIDVDLTRQESFVGWDGEILYLSEGRRLQSLE